MGKKIKWEILFPFFTGAIKTSLTLTATQQQHHHQHHQPTIKQDRDDES